MIVRLPAPPQLAQRRLALAALAAAHVALLVADVEGRPTDPETLRTLAGAERWWRSLGRETRAIRPAA